MATFWHTPYFCVKLVALSPAVLFALPFPPSLPTSESERRDEADGRRLSLGPDASRSLRLNLCESPESECTDAGFTGRTGVTVEAEVEFGGVAFLPSLLVDMTSLPPDVPADMLGARLGG